MKKSIFIGLLLLLSSCSPPTKQEALDYYLNISYKISLDILIRLDDQQMILQEYMSNPSKLTQGPDKETYSELIAEQKAIIQPLEKCILELESIDALGDKAEFLENLTTYLKARLKIEKNTKLKIVELLENGMTSEESNFLVGKTNEFAQLQQLEQKMFEAEEKFLLEFKISDADIDSGLERIKH